MNPRNAFLLSTILLAGCMTPPQRQADPFAGLEIESGRYRNLSVALILSENTKNAIKYISKFDAMVSSMFMTGSAAVGEDYFKNVVEIFRRQFGSVVKVESASSPKARAADLVAVIDAYAKFPNHIFGKASYSVTVHFIDGTGAPVATVKGESIHSPLEFKGFSGATRMKAAIRKVITEAPELFEKALTHSAELQSFASAHRSAAPPAVVDRRPLPRAVPELVSDVDTPSYRSRPRPDDFALVVGVEEYSNVPPAKFAERDARAVVAHLEAMGLPRRNIIHLSGSKAVRTGLEKYLEDWLPRNVKKSSRVYFYFSGHGAPDPTSGDAYLMPWDGDASFLKRTGYPITRLYKKLGALKVKRVIVALDACFSGAGGRSVLAEGIRPLVVKLSARKVPKKLTVFTAAGDSEVTGTLNDQGHGIFTYYFLKGLSGGAKDARGEVTAQALYDYLKPRVQDAARRQNREQLPALRGGAGVILR